MAKGKISKLISFSMKDRVGLLKEVTEKLSGAKVNITAICAYAMNDTAYFDLTADSPAKAKKALSGLDVTLEEEDVVSVEMPNRVGELHKAAKAIAEAGINISYMYGTTSSGKTSTCLFSTSDNKKALKAIK